ncbi:MAG TPA: hypothetical protein VKV28_03445 [Candidatus Binataceae bacterium]|nr:hypothetical protein [Candidatus Binataceae bacterium]
MAQAVLWSAMAGLLALGALGCGNSGGFFNNGISTAYCSQGYGPGTGALAGQCVPVRPTQAAQSRPPLLTSPTTARQLSGASPARGAILRSSMFARHQQH